MTKRRDFDIDHIDPRWEDGRDYQLVCGLDCPLNFRESDPSFNTSKSNRFLPWRWSRDEIGVVPTEPGDLAFFLVNEEWVLMEFLSPEWFEASVGTCSRSYRKVNVDSLQEGQQRFREENPERYQEVLSNLIQSGQEWIEQNKELHSVLVQNGLERFFEENPDFKGRRQERMMAGYLNWRESHSEASWVERNRIISVTTKEAMQSPKMKAKAREGGQKVTKMRYRCLITGYVSTPQWVTIHQRKHGIDPTPENRIRIE